MPRAATPRSRRTTSTAVPRKSKPQPQVVITRPAPPNPPAMSPNQIVKVEPSDGDVPAASSSKLTIIIRQRPPPPLASPFEPWKHPFELEYIRPTTWSEDTLIAHLCEHAFSIPARPTHSMDPWCTITSRDGTTTIIPRGYRLPLMFAMKFQWESLRLVMTSPVRDEEWEDYKFDILHVSRLCHKFLEEARDAMAKTGMDRMWRSHMFDRALTRYYRRWLVNREEFLRDFWREFEEEEYGRDVLKNDWARFVLKGHKGFRLTKEECLTGLSFEKLTRDLGFHNGRMNWIAPPRPPSEGVVEKGRTNDTEKESKKLNDKKRSRGKGKKVKEVIEKEKEKEGGLQKVADPTPKPPVAQKEPKPVPQPLGEQTEPNPAPTRPDEQKEPKIATKRSGEQKEPNPARNWRMPLPVPKATTRSATATASVSSVSKPQAKRNKTPPSSSPLSEASSGTRSRSRSPTKPRGTSSSPSLSCSSLSSMSTTTPSRRPRPVAPPTLLVSAPAATPKPAPLPMPLPLPLPPPPDPQPQNDPGDAVLAKFVATWGTSSPPGGASMEIDQEGDAMLGSGESENPVRDGMGKEAKRERMEGAGVDVDVATAMVGVEDTTDPALSSTDSSASPAHTVRYARKLNALSQKDAEKEKVGESGMALEKGVQEEGSIAKTKTKATSDGDVEMAPVPQPAPQSQSEPAPTPTPIPRPVFGPPRPPPASEIGVNGPAASGVSRGGGARKEKEKEKEKEEDGEKDKVRSGEKEQDKEKEREKPSSASWDARVSKALERARVAAAGPSTNPAHGGSPQRGGTNGSDGNGVGDLDPAGSSGSKSKDTSSKSKTSTRARALHMPMRGGFMPLKTKPLPGTVPKLSQPKQRKEKERGVDRSLAASAGPSATAAGSGSRSKSGSSGLATPATPLVNAPAAPAAILTTANTAINSSGNTPQETAPAAPLHSQFSVGARAQSSVEVSMEVETPLSLESSSHTPLVPQIQPSQPHSQAQLLTQMPSQPPVRPETQPQPGSETQMASPHMESLPSPALTQTDTRSLPTQTESHLAHPPSAAQSPQPEPSVQFPPIQTQTQHLPPLPGPPLPGNPLDLYKLSAAAWASGSGSSSSPENEIEMGESCDSHVNQNDTHEFQHNHFSNRSYSHEGHVYSSTPMHRRHHPYPAHARAQYHSSASASALSPYSPYYAYPSASASRHSSGMGMDMDVDPNVEIDPIEELDSSPVVKKVVAMFRDTLVGLTEILAASGAESASAARRRAKGKGRASLVGPIPSGSRSASASGSGILSGSTTLQVDEQDAEVEDREGSGSARAHSQGEVREILDEIRALMRETKEQKAEREQEARRMRVEMEDLRRQVLRLGSQRHTSQEPGRMSEASSSRGPKNEMLDGGYGRGPRESSSLSPPFSPMGSGSSPGVQLSSYGNRYGRRHNGDGIRTGARASISSSLSSSTSAHPLAHLLGLDPELTMDHDSPQPLSWMLQPGEDEEAAKPRILISPTPDENLEEEQEHEKEERRGKGSMCPPSRTVASAVPPHDHEHDDVPLPIKSQRKHRMMLLPRTLTQDRD